MEQGVGVKIMHVRNCRENRLPELPHIIIDGYSPETRKLYEFFGCYFHGNTCQPFRDVITINGDTKAELYDKAMSRLEQMTRAGYMDKVQWEWEFDDAGRTELLALQHSPLRTCDALYGGRTGAMRLHYKAREIETMQYVDVVSLYPYICKYFKFPVGHPIIHVGMRVRK